MINSAFLTRVEEDNNEVRFKPVEYQEYLGLVENR